MKSRRKRQRFIIIIGLMSLFGILFGIHHELVKNDNYPDTQLNQLTSQMAKVEKEGNAVIIFHKKGCPTCQLANNVVIKTLKEAKTSNPNVIYVVLDYQDKPVRTYFKKYKVKNTPSFIQIKSHEETRRYTGANHKKIKSIINFE